MQRQEILRGSVSLDSEPQESHLHRLCVCTFWALAVYSRLFKVFAMPSAPGFVCFPNFRYGCLSGGIVSGQSKAYDDPMLSSQDADVRTYLHALARNLQADEASASASRHVIVFENAFYGKFRMGKPKGSQSQTCWWSVVIQTRVPGKLLHSGPAPMRECSECLGSDEQVAKRRHRGEFQCVAFVFSLPLYLCKSSGAPGADRGGRLARLWQRPRRPCEEAPVHLL